MRTSYISVILSALALGAGCRDRAVERSRLQEATAPAAGTTRAEEPPPVPTSVTTVTHFELFADAAPLRGSTEEEEPRGSARYSIIEAPNLEKNLGLVLADGGAAPPAPPQRALRRPPSEPDTQDVGPPSAADRIPWSGTRD